MKEGEKVDSYIAKTPTIVNKMKVNGETLDPSNVVSKVLRSLTPKFNYVVCSIDESNNLDTMTIYELHGSLLVQEQRMLGQRDEEHALKIVSESTPRGRGRGGYRGRGRGRGRYTVNMNITQCYKCHKIGHWHLQYECPEWEKDDVNYVEFDDSEEMVLMADSKEKQTTKDQVWFLDSGCSNHMSGDKRCFCSLDETYRHSVKLENNSRMAVMGKGNVRLAIKGMNHVLTGVYFVPTLKSNSISIGQLQEKGVAILIQHGRCSVYHPKKGLIIQTPMTRNRMYIAVASLVENASTCFKADVEEETKIWHQRYGHINIRSLKMLKSKEMVIGLPTIREDD
ncbi:unnamed protein product [Rhodiola kirilowii]